VGIALGLGAALSWGLADYFAARGSRTIGALRIVLGFHLASMVPLTILVLATGALSDVKADQLPLFVVLGGVGWLSYLAFYGALSIGPISVLSPIVSGYAAVTVLFAVAIRSEVLSVGEVVAVVAVIGGAMVSSANVRDIARARIDRRTARGFVLALIAMALLGGFVFGVSYYHRSLGWLAPIFLARGFTTLFLLAHVGLRSGGIGLPLPRSLLPTFALLALLDTGGYAFFNLGANHAATSVVATASAPYAVVPIVMGVWLLRERPTPVQWSGVALIIGGLITLGLSS
jgi:drug/metabolite transporter (DMT)-like permease